MELIVFVVAGFVYIPSSFGCQDSNPKPLGLLVALDHSSSPSFIDMFFGVLHLASPPRNGFHLSWIQTHTTTRSQVPLTLEHGQFY